MILRGLGVLLLCATVAVSQTDTSRPKDDSAIRKGTVHVQVTPDAQPGSLLEAIRGSALIIDGTVGSVLPSVNRSDNDDKPLLETESIVLVNSVFKGAVPNSAASILLSQVGGKTDRWTVEVEGDTLVSAGARYILFLIPDDRKAVANPLGMPRYAVLGVWSGKMKVSDQKISVAAAAGDKLRSHNGEDVDAFIEALKETIRKPYSDTKAPIFPNPKTVVR